MTSTPAGWYADPATAGTEHDAVRYWDGETWTEHVAARSGPARGEDRIEWFALVLALLPLIGIIGGLVSVVKGHHRTGALMIVIGFSSITAMSVLRGLGG